ncbi:MAG: septal ring lytic transglycosylase RlpA family protein, partial [Leptolyngbya sp. ERB_1_2]
MYQLAKTDNSIGGMASWYGPYFHGRQTANGEIFDQDELTAAHPTLPLGTFLKVTNRLNGKSIVVRVNDRGPYFDNRVLDLSRR